VNNLQFEDDSRSSKVECDDGDTNKQKHDPKARKYSSSHLKEFTIGDPSSGAMTRLNQQSKYSNIVFPSHIEPKNINDAIDPAFFVRNNV